jgi:SagB-type dehydrogenase family enzyme
VDGEFLRCFTRRDIVKYMLKGFIMQPFLAVAPCLFALADVNRTSIPKEVAVKLPKPGLVGKISVEQAIQKRRTVRSFRKKSLQSDQFSQLLWAAQGITEEGGYKRAAPSAGALYPMDLYAVVGSGCVEEVNEGIYHYEPGAHTLSLNVDGEMRQQLAHAALSQKWMAQAPVNFIITAEYDRITGKYGQRGVRYAMIEAGHIAQNIFLQARALGLDAGIVGAFVDEDVVGVLKIPASHAPLIIMPVGYAR